MADNVVTNLPHIHVPLLLQEGQNLILPVAAGKHIQVLRLQPQDNIYLFNGTGGQWLTTITEMARNHVQVHIGPHQLIERETDISVSLLVGIPANERMDFLIEKATELGVMEIYPLMFSRSVVKLKGERANKKQAHWQTIAIAACEQCGRNRIPQIHPVMPLTELLQNHVEALPEDRRLLSFRADSSLWNIAASLKTIAILSGPEGGLSSDEEKQLIQKAGFKPYTLGPRVLRADTAPLAALSTLTFK